jgi:hypothetical protein
VLVLPYLAGDSELLAGTPGARTLGVALGSDLLRRRPHPRRDRSLRRALARYTALWAVSAELAETLARRGRRPDWVASVGVDLDLLPAGTEAFRRGRLVSPRRQGPVYRHDLIRTTVSGTPELTLVEADDWPRPRLLREMAEAELVISLAETDGAPATIMEALCLGTHVVASGGSTVRGWLEEFGGTYGEPNDAEAARQLLAAARARASRESSEDRARRAAAARQAFDRDLLLSPLEAWLRTGFRSAARRE